MEDFCTTEEVVVRVGKAPFDAQVAVGTGAFGLGREGVPVGLLHGDAAIQKM